MASPSEWLAATRPRTLPAAIAPVVVGWASAWHDGHDIGTSYVVAVLAMVVALALQIGVNFSNDYSDGIRGTDEVRVGPVRLVGQKLAPASQVKAAAFALFAVAAVAGLGVVASTGKWQMLIVGALAILSAWFYTGGKNPYGYLGLGEVFVFVWFGLAAVQGTVFVLLGRTTALGWLFGVGAGALSCALLVANNLRDVPTDALSGKRTLAVRLGASRTRWLYVGLVWTSLVVPFIAIAGGATRWLALSLLAAVAAHRPGWAVIRGAAGRDLLPVLAATGRALLVWAATISLGLWLGTHF